MSTIAEINTEYLTQYKNLLGSKTNYARHLSIETEIAGLENSLAEKKTAHDEEIASNGSAEAVIQLDREIVDLQDALIVAKKIKAQIDWRSVLSEEEVQEFEADYFEAIDEIVQPKKTALINALTSARNLIQELLAMDTELERFKTSTRELQSRYIYYPSGYYSLRQLDNDVLKCIMNIPSM